MSHSVLNKIDFSNYIFRMYLLSIYHKYIRYLVINYNIYFICPILLSALLFDCQLNLHHW